jgi:hypothetical protein
MVIIFCHQNIVSIRIEERINTLKLHSVSQSMGNQARSFRSSLTSHLGLPNSQLHLRKEKKTKSWILLMGYRGPEKDIPLDLWKSEVGQRKLSLNAVDIRIRPWHWFEAVASKIRFLILNWNKFFFGVLVLFNLKSLLRN